ncbi:MAG: hypothetical protein Q9205_007726 [Flavoplaca limonia]
MLKVRQDPRAYAPITSNSNPSHQHDPTSSSDNIPLIDLDSRPEYSNTSKPRRSRWPQRYHFGIRCCAAIVAVILLTNVILTVVVVSKTKLSDSGVAVVRDGDCSTTKRLNILLHLLLNLLSTLLLCASNYCVQCLSAPTRKDIDNAHAQHKWMDIGVPSIRNLGYLSWPKKTLWGLLVVSSIPLHLVFNGVIYFGYSGVIYDVYVVTQDFAKAEIATSENTQWDGYYEPDWSRIPPLYNSLDSLSEMDAKTCAQTLDQSWISEWSALLVVLSYRNATHPLRRFFRPANVLPGSGHNPIECGPNDEQEGGWCDTGLGDNNVADHLCGVHSSYEGHARACYIPVSHCLAQEVEQHCTLSFHVPIMIAVIICNIVKLGCIVGMIWRTEPTPLITVGDAVASFLDDPASLITAMVLFSVTVSDISDYNASLDPDFGSFYYTILTRGGGNKPGILTLIFIANSPQLILSILYFSYNGLITFMLMADEWSGFSTERKGLRVTSASGAQRSTYRLQVPYRYAVPLITVSVVMHWLVSQSLYVEILQAYDHDGVYQYDEIWDCGFLPRAILITICLGLAVLVVGILMGFRKYKPGIPLVGSCSAAISAACHPPQGDDKPSRKAVRWGSCGPTSTLDMTGDNLTLSSGESEIGHCSLTSFNVEPPVEGALYAALRKRKEI